MEDTISIINIRYKTYTLKDEEIIILAKDNEFKYKFIPVVAYNTKTSNKYDLSIPILESFNKEKPFTLYELGTPIAILKSYMGNKLSKEDLLSAKKAFKILKNFASNCYERIIADLSCQVILKTIRNNINSNQHLVFFIEKSASDKMLGRLASLYLNLDKVTICFIISDPSDLMTTVMSNQTGKLHFDIHRLCYSETIGFFGPYPGDYEDSLIQTYFYKPLSLHSDGKYRPLRLDIFAQGLLRDQIEEKKELIETLLNPESPNSVPERKETEPRLLMPYGFEELKGYFEMIEQDIKEKILFE